MLHPTRSHGALPCYTLNCVVPGGLFPAGPLRAWPCSTSLLPRLPLCLLQWLLHCCCAKSALIPSIFPHLCWPMGRSIAPVFCTTLWVTGGGRKPTTCALLRSGVKSLPCKRRNPLASFPVPSSGPLPIASSGSGATAVLPTAALAVAATAASAAEHQSTLISLCASYHIISTGAHMHSYSIHLSLHFLHCSLVQEEQGTCAC